MSYIHDLNALERLYCHLPALQFEDATAFLRQLTRNPAFVATHLIPSLASLAPAREPSIAISYGTREIATCLQVFVWPAGAATPIHDHTSWGAYHCVSGTLLEQRYERLDNGAQPNRARLRQSWRRAWRSDDGTSTVLPYERGIHRIANPSTYPAISLHLYGARLGCFDGRDYDTTRDIICDRIEADQVAALTAPVLLNPLPVL